MICDDYKPLLAGYVDSELTLEEGEHLRDHLSQCGRCREDLVELKELRGLTVGVQSLDKLDAFWDRYWLGIYNRLERGLSWVFVSIGALLLGGYGLFHLVRELFLDASVPIVVRVGLGFALAGSLMLFGSVLRNHLHTWHHDPYREIKR